MIQRAITAEEISRKLRPLFGKRMDEIYFRYSVADTLEEKNEIFQLLSRLYQKHLSKLLDGGILLEPPIEKDVSGEYPLGKVSYAKKELYNFSLKEKDWSRHMCVTGMSGSGKTTFAFKILKNFIEKDKPFLVFDWKKSFRPLIGIDNKLMIFTIGKDSVSNLFKTNINRPPKGVNPKEWINTLSDLITESFSASFGVHKIILETLNEAFESWGIYEGGDHYPNWQHIKKLMEQKSRDAKSRESGWYESALRIASVMTFGYFGKSINYDGKRNLQIEDLFNKRVVLELNSLSNTEKKFFSEYILTYIFKLKKAEQNKVKEVFNYAILVDEAHNIFLKKDTNFMSESVTDMIYREMREYGTSLICLDQHISKLSDTVVGNSACHIAFQQQLPKDIETVSSIMQLRNDRELFSQIPVGQAIVKISERYAKPFLVDMPFTDLQNQMVTDEKIRNKMQCMIEVEMAKKNDKKFIKETISPPITISNAEIIIDSSASNNIEKKQKSFSYILPEKEEAIISNNMELPEITAENTKSDKTTKQDLSDTQNILFDFVCKKQKEKMNLPSIEKLLELGLHEKKYSANDILKVINYAMKSELEKTKLPVDNLKTPEDIALEEDKIAEEYIKNKVIAWNNLKNKTNFKLSENKTVKNTENNLIKEKNQREIKENFDKKIETPQIDHIKIIEDNEKAEVGESIIIQSKEKNKAINKIDISKLLSKISPQTTLSPEEASFLLFLLKNPNHKNPTVQFYKNMGFSSRKGNVIKNKLLEKKLIRIEEEITTKGWKKYIRLTTKLNPAIPQ